MDDAAPSRGRNLPSTGAPEQRQGRPAALAMALPAVALDELWRRHFCPNSRTGAGAPPAGRRHGHGTHHRLAQLHAPGGGARA
jgi:hypothetical protein